jgi:hypothetical protein
MLLSIVSTESLAPSVESVSSQASGQEAQEAPAAAGDQVEPFDQDAAMLAATGSIYQTVSITQITSQTPNGPWAISGHVNVTGFVMRAARQVDGDMHVPFCDSPHFTVVANASALPDKHHCVMAEIVPYLQCTVPAQLPAQQTIRGLLRFDGGSAAEWWEIHPIEFMTSGSCRVVGTPSVP